ncbi:DNA primase [subsurface metagenome]
MPETEGEEYCPTCLSGFELKKPLMPSGAGKRYYPGYLIDALEIIETIIKTKALKDERPTIRRKSNWKPRPGAKYVDADKLLEAVDIVEVVSAYTQLRGYGTEQRGICPLHGSKSTSLKVNISKQLFHCFGCAKGGNAINFIMEIEGIIFKDAVAFLAERYNVKSE